LFEIGMGSGYSYFEIAFPICPKIIIPIIIVVQLKTATQIEKLYHEKVEQHGFN